MCKPRRCSHVRLASEEQLKATKRLLLQMPEDEYVTPGCTTLLMLQESDMQAHEP